MIPKLSIDERIGGDPRLVCGWRRFWAYYERLLFAPHPYIRQEFAGRSFADYVERAFGRQGPKHILAAVEAMDRELARQFVEESKWRSAKGAK